MTGRPVTGVSRPSSLALCEGLPWVAVACDRVPPALAALAACASPAVPGTGARRAAVLVDGGLDRNGLTRLLAGEAGFVVEADENPSAGASPDPGPCPDPGWTPVTVPQSLFALSLSTRTSWTAQPAAAVCDALVLLGVLDSNSRGTVELCLHEAVANAIVHGNLGIASAAKNHPEGYETFGRLLSERLADPWRRRLRLAVAARWGDGWLEVAVTDEGQGFDLSLLPQAADGNSRSGRGFVFMRALAAAVDVGDGGRCTRLRFALA